MQYYLLKIRDRMLSNSVAITISTTYFRDANVPSYGYGHFALFIFIYNPLIVKCRFIECGKKSANYLHVFHLKCIPTYFSSVPTSNTLSYSDKK